ncbi:MAG TPA: YgaP-like transmembrane domain [Acidimicrobiales bacterium]|nr:YgaP-like transmembrane domain [Acidimicrobiales bacterium]
MRNEATLDRWLRGVLAVVAAIVAIAVGSSSVGGVILWIVAVALALTAATGFCPLYRVLKMSTYHH